MRQEHDNQQSERIRIEQLEKETNEKLVDIYEKLTQAGVDQQESARDARLKETLANLQRLFPGVRGRVVDCCKPTQRKYETAISVVFGRNIDAIVVDEEKTAIDCIEVRRALPAGCFRKAVRGVGVADSAVGSTCATSARGKRRSSRWTRSR